MHFLHSLFYFRDPAPELLCISYFWYILFFSLPLPFFTSLSCISQAATNLSHPAPWPFVSVTILSLYALLHAISLYSLQLKHNQFLAFPVSINNIYYSHNVNCSSYLKYVLLLFMLILCFLIFYMKIYLKAFPLFLVLRVQFADLFASFTI